MTAPVRGRGPLAWWTDALDPRWLAAQRIGTFGFAAAWILIRFTAVTRVGGYEADRFDPVGPVALVLDAPLSPTWVTALAVLAALSAATAAAGWAYRISAPVAALSVLWVLTYRNSWGVVLHTENLVVLHALVLAVAPAAADAWSVDARRRERRPRPSVDHRWPLLVMGLVTALAYVVAGWAKIRNGGFDWLSGDVLRSHVASDNLRKELLGDPSSPLVAPVLGWSFLWAPMGIASLVIELGAPLALIRPVWARTWTVLAWLFHVGVLALMAILFPYQLLGLALLPWWAASRPPPTDVTLGPADDETEAQGSLWAT